MERIVPGKYVEITYDLYKINDNGTEELVHQVDPEDPECFVFGVTRGMIEPLEKVLMDKQVGDTYDVLVPSAEAFGPYDPEQVATLEKEIFMVDDKFDEKVIHVGALVPMLTADGYRINGLVKEITPDKVVMDFNHPLAGKDVRFKGTVKTVRDATEEELKPAGCCCSGGECGSGECGGGDCSGCGCE